MSFLGKGIKPGVAPVIGKPVAPKPAIGGIKPVVGIKPGIKPVIKPVTTETTEKEQVTVDPVVTEEKESKLSISPKAAVTPAMQLPTMKMPSINPIKQKEEKAEETKVTEEVVEETVDTQEEVQQEMPEVTEKEEVAKEEVAKEESTEKTVEEKHPREIALEQAKEEELVYGEYTLKEWNEMSPQKRGAITRTKAKEAKEQRTSNKATNKTEKQSTKTQTVKETTEFTPTLLPQRSTVDYEELIANLVITSLGEEWDKMVEQIRMQLKSIQITPDMNSATMKQSTADLAALRDEIFYEATQAKTTFEGVLSKIDVVKGLNTKGSSPDERKLNGLRACVHYSENGYEINLYELLEVARVKHNFFSETMKQIEYKKNALITMNGALKLEKDLGIQ